MWRHSLIWIAVSIVLGLFGAVVGVDALTDWNVGYALSHYAPFLAGLGSIASAFVALGIALENWRKAREPDIVIRPNRGRRQFECRLENLGGQPVRIEEGEIWAEDEGIELSEEWDEEARPILLLPDEWWPGFSLDIDDIRDKDVEKIGVWFRYEAIQSGESGEEEYVFREDVHVSNPRTKKREVSFHDYDELVRKSKAHLEPEEEDS